MVKLLCAVILVIAQGDFPFVSTQQQTRCDSPYTCISAAECGRLHAPYGGISEILFKCSGRGLKVCCPQLPAVDEGNIDDNAPLAEVGEVGTTGTPAAKPVEYTDLSNFQQHRNVALLPENCGLILDDKITNGENATVGQYPWMALIGFTGRGDKRKNNCGGTLISDFYVLTAAHCLVVDNAVLTHVTLGEFDLSKENDCNGEICYQPPLEVPVEKVIPHPRWDPTSYQNDIALLRLSYNVSSEGRANVFPICLPLDVSRLNLASKNYQYEAVGWGITSNGDEEFSPILQRVNLYDSECNVCKPGATNVAYCPLTEKQLCAQGFRRKDVCKGDSGGPLTSTNFPRTIQLGITSFKSTSVCGEDNVPSVFTRVHGYMDWILDNLEP